MNTPILALVLPLFATSAPIGAPQEQEAPSESLRLRPGRIERQALELAGVFVAQVKPSSLFGIAGHFRLQEECVAPAPMIDLQIHPVVPQIAVGTRKDVDILNPVALSPFFESGSKRNGVSFRVAHSSSLRVGGSLTRRVDNFYKINTIT